MNWSMTTSTQSLWSTMDAQRQRSTLHRLSVVCPTNDNHEGPVPPGAGRERFASTRCTTFLSDVDPERLRDDARNPRAPESRIARFELDDWRG